MATSGSRCCGIARVGATHFLFLPAVDAPRRSASVWESEVNMADVSERTLQVAVVASFAAGFLAGWQANRMRRKFLDWRKKRLQEKLSETQKKLDLA